MWWFGPYISTNQPQACICLLPLVALPSPSLPLLLSRLSQSTGFGFPASNNKLPLALYLTYGNMYISLPFLQIIPPSPSLTVSKNPFFMSASPLLLCK